MTFSKQKQISNAGLLKELARKYNSPEYFVEDPIAFPRHFFKLFAEGKARREDIEIAGLLAAHLAWGRRQMIVRDCGRLFDEMQWKPYEYIMGGQYRDCDESLHRTIKWKEIALICGRLRKFYDEGVSPEELSTEEIRTDIFGSRTDKNAANKKINMFRRWMVRRDGIVDFGIWTKTDPKDLLIPLDVHVHDTALELGLTRRNGADLRTVLEITEVFREIFPEDPCLGDFALFGYGIDKEGD